MMQIWIFSIITPVFRVTWSFRNNSNLLICCLKNVSIILETIVLPNIFVETVIRFSPEFFKCNFFVIMSLLFIKLTK